MYYSIVLSIELIEGDMSMIYNEYFFLLTDCPFPNAMPDLQIHVYCPPARLANKFNALPARMNPHWPLLRL